MNIPFASEKIEELVKNMVGVVGDFKGENIVILDVQRISSLTDYLMIANFSVFTQIEGAYEELVNLVKDRGIFIQKQKSMSKARNWIVLDAGFIICHLMSTETRAFYDLEKLWENRKVLMDFSI